MRFAENTNAPVRRMARLCLDSDIHVLSERGQEPHQALARKVG
jgi:hypothetical protein